MHPSKPTNSPGLQLDEVIPWGRSFEEYRRMFALSSEDLGGLLLGCGDGPASFNAEATARGHRVISCDPLYAFSGRQIEQRVNDCYEAVILHVRRNPDRFVWEYFADPDHLGRCRLAAMHRFLADFEDGKNAGRYVTAALPDLPFADQQFDLALVSHLLFLYSDLLNLEFHQKSIKELTRVAREVRIFPLLTLDGTSSPHIGPIRSHLASRGYTAEPISVPYEFQRGGKEMLCIGRMSLP